MIGCNVETLFCLEICIRQARNEMTEPDSPERQAEPEHVRRIGYVELAHYTVG